MNNRVTLDVHDEWQTDAEKDLSVRSDLAVNVDTERTPIAWIGLVTMLVGSVLFTVGGFLFAAAYPDAWYALDRAVAASQGRIRLIMTMMGLGTVGVFLGTSMYFFGRSMRGRGQVDRIRMGDSL